MERLVYVLFALFFISCSDNKDISIDLVNNPLSADKEYNISTPEIHLSESSFNFGDVIEGEIVSHKFIIKNTGSANLLINTAKASCGCTVPNWPTQPILPGKDDFIQVTFDSSNRKGKQKKTVTLVTNAIPNTKVLFIKANIIPKE